MNKLDVPIWAWVALGVIVVVSLAADLFGHRGGHGLGRKRAIAWSVMWVALSAAFCGWLAVQFGARAAGEFATAWLVEKSLSVDNLFVFLLVFATLGIPEREQHRVLFWGIFGALVMRGLFIAGGAALLEAWHGIVYPMGLFLILAGVKAAREPPGESKTQGKLLAFVRRHLPYTDRLHGHHFYVREGKRRVATPLFLALVVIELTDVVFAVDSIPAVFAVTRDPFLVYSSNIFAILGLRALYLVLATTLVSLPHLRYALGAILAFAGGKMLTSSFLHVPHWASLGIIVSILVATIVAGAVARRRRPRVALA